MLGTTEIALAGAFLAGLISFVSPCVLPLVPGYVSYIAGQSLATTRQPPSPSPRLSVVGLSVAFVLGFSTVFITLGASATALGQWLLGYRAQANLAGGVIVIIFGLYMTGLLRPSWLGRDMRFHGAVANGKPAGAFILGLGFAFGWTPCIGPMLGAILTISATTATIDQGIVYLGVYALGLGLPFVGVAALAGGEWSVTTRFRRMGRYIEIAAGMVMVFMGAAMITGRMSSMSVWLLEQFPELGRIG